MCVWFFSFPVLNEKTRQIRATGWVQDSQADRENTSKGAGKGQVSEPRDKRLPVEEL